MRSPILPKVLTTMCRVLRSDVLCKRSPSGCIASVARKRPPLPGRGCLFWSCIFLGGQGSCRDLLLPYEQEPGTGPRSRVGFPKRLFHVDIATLDRGIAMSLNGLPTRTQAAAAPGERVSFFVVHFFGEVKAPAETYSYPMNRNPEPVLAHASGFQKVCSMLISQH